ncbi:LPD7 domain-containing protein [Mixta mediterraneensis]|uniref:LPD7 domain-containing protein n=1 Tax=Mixta mediterraneensis TaxID=2758443 RepID=UPI0018773316|nr:LPD7 domain-containing protein [Mixta mediterraneensis]MBE5254656.1 hypothetical protein [Mixta mediterraneensis]
MLIRVSGYNAGVKEYLEEGVKNGRDYSRDELDERVILDGDLNLTDRIYKSIPDRGQNRYTTFTLSFREDEIPNHVLQSITKEFRDFMMYAYEEDEYNFYAEAHIPKIKEVFDKRTGEKIERKPHIHIVVPKVNLLSGRVNDVIGDPNSTEKYLEAFQEYINQKYDLASPREHVRVNPYNSADVLSRYKGDDFRGKNREFKQNLVKEVIDSDIRTRHDFYSAVARYGETKIRNHGKDNEYIAVKLEGDEKFTNLKEIIFNDNFIAERKLSKPPLAKNIIADRLHEWPMRSKEIKYVAKASKSFRDNYYSLSSVSEKVNKLAEEQFTFYEKFGGQHELHPSERAGSHQRSSAETGRGRHAGVTHSMQSVSSSDVAADRQTRVTTGAVFLPGNARVYVEQSATGGDSGLRSDLYVRRTGRTEANRERDQTGREGRERAAEGAGEARERTESYRERETQAGTGAEGSSEQTGPGGERAISQGGTSSGGSRQSRASADQGREETAEDHSSAGVYPNDNGSREAYRYTGVPELGRSDSTFTVRGGSGPGNRQLGIPVYARNTRRVADIKAIERNSDRVFGGTASERPRGQNQVRLIRRLMPKAPKDASYVAACLQRRQEQNTLSSPQRRALYQADQKYFQARRTIISDTRLSSKDKTQFLAVLMFERLKAHQLIKEPYPHNQQEDYAMSSENIRSKMKPEPKYRNTVSGAEEPEQGPQDAKERFRKLNQQIENDLGERSLREKVRIITAADLYTRKAKLSDNVHYLDNSSHKTLFIDTGKTIAVSKHGLSDSAVAVALELAKEKFGSTLTVKGTESFKNTAIEVVAQKGLDIHFTDKEMNRRLAERKQELALEREGQNISSAESARPESPAEFKKAFDELVADFNGLANKSDTLDAASLEKELSALSKESAGLRNYWMSSDDFTPDAGLENRSIELEESLRETLSQKYDSERAGKEVAEFHATWQSNIQKDTPTRTQEFEAAFSEIEKLYDMLDKNAKNLTPDELSAYAASGREKRVELSSTYYAPEFKARLEGMEDKLSKTISQMASQQNAGQDKPSQQSQKAQQQHTQSSRPITHEGVLLEHGSAPYNFKPDMSKPENERDDSYYVKLQGPRGREKLVWGVTLEKAVEGLEIGERVSLTNLGKETVEWEQKLANGQTEQRTGERVAWEGVPLDREVNIEESQAQQYQAYEQYQSTESDGPSVN